MKTKFQKTHFFLGVILAAFLLAMLPGIHAMAIEEKDDNPTDEKIFEGYVPSTYKKFVGYKTEYFNFEGGHYSRFVREYETYPCCKPTGHDMDGCSAPVICPKY